MSHRKSFIAALIGFLLVLCLGAGVALAVTSIIRNVNITIADGMAVDRNPTELMTLYKNTSESIIYTVTNTSDSNYNVTVTCDNLPTGVTAAITPAGTFFLASKDSRQVQATFTADSTAVAGIVSLTFTNDLS